MRAISAATKKEAISIRAATMPKSARSEPIEWDSMMG
jgi:hypothetical protein